MPFASKKDDVPFPHLQQALLEDRQAVRGHRPHGAADGGHARDHVVGVAGEELGDADDGATQRVGLP